MSVTLPVSIYYSQHVHSIRTFSTPVLLDRRVAARYRVLASIIPGRERFSWNW